MDLRKHGDTVEFWLDNALALTTRIRIPLEGGIPAIWTSDGGISIARLRLSYANAPQPRTEAQVMLEHPLVPGMGERRSTVYAGLSRPLVHQ